MSYLVLARKWRPQRFDEVVGQKHVSLTLSNALKTGRLSHAYLFSGPRGVGKTSMARILAKALNCEEGPTPDPCNQCSACRSITAGHCLDVLEIDGASNRGIDDVRQLRDSVKYAPASVRTKVYIIDEVHMLTTDAFNALLKTLEEPPRHVCFVLATTEPLKVPPTILSRCQRFDFGRLTVAELVAHLEKIVTAESIQVDTEGLRLLARKADGSARDSLTLLDQVAATGEGPFDALAIQKILGLSGTGLYFEISAAVIAADGPAALRCLQGAYQEGLNLQEVAEELVRHFRNVLLLSLGEGLEEILETTADEKTQLLEQVHGVRPGDALRWMRILLDTSPRMRRSAHARVHLEIALVEMAALPRSVDLRSVLARLRADEHTSGPAPGAAGGGTPGSGRVNPPGGRAGTDAAPANSGPAAASGGAAAGIADQGLAQVWAEICDRISRERAFLGSCLHGSRVTGIADGRLQVALDDTNGFKQDQVAKPANRRFIGRMIEEILGRPLGLRLVGSDQPGGGSNQTDSLQDDPRTAAGAEAPAEQSAEGADRVRKIAEMMDGDIIGPAR